MQAFQYYLSKMCLYYILSQVGLYYNPYLHGFRSSSLLSRLELFEVLVIRKILFWFDKTQHLLFFFFILYFSFLFRFSFLLFLPVSEQFSPRKIVPWLWLGLKLVLGLGFGLGPIFLGGDYLRTVFTSGKQGDLLHANEMLGFIHFLHVQSSSFLYILNELNGVS